MVSIDALVTLIFVALFAMFRAFVVGMVFGAMMHHRGKLRIDECDDRCGGIDDDESDWWKRGEKSPHQGD